VLYVYAFATAIYQRTINSLEKDVIQNWQQKCIKMP